MSSNGVCRNSESSGVMKFSSPSFVAGEICSYITNGFFKSGGFISPLADLFVVKTCKCWNGCRLLSVYTLEEVDVD